MKHNVVVIVNGTWLYVARTRALTWTMDRSKAKPFSLDRGWLLVNDIRLHGKEWPILMKAEVKL